MDMWTYSGLLENRKWIEKFLLIIKYPILYHSVNSIQTILNLFIIINKSFNSLRSFLQYNNNIIVYYT